MDSKPSRSPLWTDDHPKNFNGLKTFLKNSISRSSFKFQETGCLSKYNFQGRRILRRIFLDKNHLKVFSSKLKNHWGSSEFFYTEQTFQREEVSSAVFLMMAFLMFRNFPKNFYKQKSFQRSYIAAEKLLNTACLPEDFRKVRSLFKCLQIEDFSKKTSSLKASYTQKVFHTEPIFQNTNKRSIFIYLPTGGP